MAANIGGRNGDLGIRALSAVILLCIAVPALWFGGTVFALLALVLAAAILWEFAALFDAILMTNRRRTACLAFAFVYVAMAVTAVVAARHTLGFAGTLWMLGTVWVTDIGAYFAGRTFGGPKIAPAVSPSKTWSGLIGGMIAALLLSLLFAWGLGWSSPLLTLGAPLAALAQAGDFFESWLKRRANVKDASALIPGHGGVLDRLDGLMPVAIAVGAALYCGYY